MYPVPIVDYVGTFSSSNIAVRGGLVSSSNISVQPDRVDRMENVRWERVADQCLNTTEVNAVPDSFSSPSSSSAGTTSIMLS